ncbi:carbohydrate ABC transporter permease [Paenibacillus sp. HJGM_3]|uniref:carbohydrate ABC transporter permease n=1 Tax=Paenibacillus sp. HJGM_3 TaxID=3379816 RepID=UPI003858188C
MQRYNTPSRTAFNIFNYTLFVLFGLSILAPFLNAIAISLSSADAVIGGQVRLWPVGFQLDAYHKLVNNTTFMRSAVNTVFLTVVNTILDIVVSLAAAYALSHKDLIGKRTVFVFLLITMYFGGGLIPTYLLVTGMGLQNSYWALILPGIANTFYIIVYKNTIDQLPRELLDAAEVDGANEFAMLFRIIVPMVLPMSMAFTIFSAVAHWNMWFGVALYIRDKDLWTLQYQLREILINAQLVNNETGMEMARGEIPITPENLKMAAVMITVLPIIVIYPFVQKYFIKGQFVGAVKG